MNSITRRQTRDATVSQRWLLGPRSGRSAHREARRGCLPPTEGRCEKADRDERQRKHDLRPRSSTDRLPPSRASQSLHLPLWRNLKSYRPAGSLKRSQSESLRSCSFDTTFPTRMLGRMGNTSSFPTRVAHPQASNVGMIRSPSVPAPVVMAIRSIQCRTEPPTARKRLSMPRLKKSMPCPFAASSIYQPVTEPITRGRPPSRAWRHETRRV